MAKTPIFTGSCTAIVTPYLENGVDYEKYAELIDFQYEGGTSAILVCGTTGENPTHTEEEHNKLVELTVEKCAGRMKVIAGVGSYNTEHALEQARQAEAAGADGILMVTPYYNKSTQKGLIEHFTYVADRVNVPMILYNVPGRTGIGIKPATYKALSKHPNINGLKAASGNFSLLAEVMAKCGDELNVWSGNDDQIVPLMALGGKGVISVLSNVAPQETHDLTQLCFENRYPEAAKMQFKYHNLIDALFCEVNPIPVKKAMELLGWNVGPLRLPLVEPSEEHIAQIQRELLAAGCKI